MIGRHRFASAALALALGFQAAAGAAIDFFKKPKSESQVKKLVETMKADADEKKRRAAVVELRDADPRVHTDVIPALIAALQNDFAPAVRQEVAETLASYKLAYPLAGLALEAASELDSSREVRDAALQALWEYHLAGYRSPRGANGIAGQTAEPPIARPLAIHRSKVTAASALDIPIPMAMPAEKPVKPAALPQSPPQSKPLIKPIFDGPVLARRPVFNSLTALKSALPSFGKPAAVNDPIATPEPPTAAPRVVEAAPEPRSVAAAPTHVATPQPFELPSLVEPPGELLPVIRPMLTPSEPPVGPRVRPSR